MISKCPKTNFCFLFMWIYITSSLSFWYQLSSQFNKTVTHLLKLSFRHWKSECVGKSVSKTLCCMAAISSLVVFAEAPSMLLKWSTWKWNSTKEGSPANEAALTGCHCVCVLLNMMQQWIWYCEVPSNGEETETEQIHRYSSMTWRCLKLKLMMCQVIHTFCIFKKVNHHGNFLPNAEKNIKYILKKSG